MKVLRRLAFGALLLAAFAWGFATDRFKVFPIGLIRKAALMRGVGGWHKTEELHSRSPAAAALMSVPYLTGRFDPKSSLKGVTTLAAGRVAPGLFFYSTLARARGFLIDEKGHVRWEWNVDRYFDRVDLPQGVDLGYPHLFPNGDVLAYVGDRALLKLDKSSNLIWKYVARVHHDAFVADDGAIWTLSHTSRVVPEIDPRVPSLLDLVTELSPDGAERREIPVLDIVQRSRYAFLLPRTNGLPLAPGTDSVDVFHTNHIEVFDGSLERLSPLYRRGNFLLSMKNLNAVAIVDGRTLDILWLWGPTNITLQHAPTLLADGHVLLFDNGTAESAVVEVDPATNAVVWRYAPKEGFFSAIQGACQRLPNGDTLITVSQAGNAIDVTPSGETVWAFYNPEVSAAGVREGIYRMTRYREEDLPFLKAVSESARNGRAEASPPAPRS